MSVRLCLCVRVCACVTTEDFGGGAWCRWCLVEGAASTGRCVGLADVLRGSEQALVGRVVESVLQGTPHQGHLQSAHATGGRPHSRN